MDTIFIEKRIEDVVREYARLVSKIYNLSEVYLYGSYAKGQNTIDSDIDIALISYDFGDDMLDNMLVLMQIRRKVDSRIEPHPFHKSDFDISDPFVKEILNTGIRII